MHPETVRVRLLIKDQEADDYGVNNGDVAQRGDERSFSNLVGLYQQPVGTGNKEACDQEKSTIFDAWDRSVSQPHEW